MGVEAIQRGYEAAATKPFGFDGAINLLKKGRKVAREGWNGKGMYIFLSEVLAAEAPIQFSGPSRCLCMKDAHDNIVPGWLASQTDMLAEDWVEVG